MDLGSHVERDTGASEAPAFSHGDPANLEPAAHATVESSVVAQAFVLEAEKLIDDIRLALACDLGVATKKAATLSLLLKNKGRQRTRPALVRGGLAAWQRKKVQTYIREGLDGPLPIEELAKLVALSYGYFCRAFKDSFGESPHAHIMRLRIEHAQMLMTTTPERLSHIALACGFVDQPHLCRCFLQITGTTPNAWRRRNAPGPSSAATALGRPDTFAAGLSYLQRAAAVGESVN